MTDWSGGYNRRRLVDFYGQADAPTQFWEAQNINVYDLPGKFFLTAAFNRIGAQEATDKEYLFYAFNLALYKLPTANFAAADFQKLTSATGAPAWAALTNIYPGSTAIRNAVAWKDQLVIASGENLLRVMSKTETWSTIAPPGSVTANAIQVGIGPDDRLLGRWESQGLYAYDGSTWNKVFPTPSAALAADPYCDLIVRGSGSTIFVTRDSSGRSTLYEYFIEPTGTGFRVWLQENGMRMWPQSADVYDDATYIVGRMGAAGNVGVLFRKEYLSPPIALDFLDTNGATDGLAGQDWSWRCIRAVGDALWIGGSSREDRDACVYRYFVDESGQVMMPTAIVEGIAGPIYSIGFLPYEATGAATSERTHISVSRATYYKDRDGDSAPSTGDAATGFIQFPDIDYGTDDKLKLGRLVAVYLSQKSVGGTIDIQYRVDPQTEADPWRSFGQAIAQGLTSKEMPDDNPALAKYGTRFRRLQLRIVLTRATSGTVRDVIDTVLVDSAAILSLAETA